MPFFCLVARFTTGVGVSGMFWIKMLGLSSLGLVRDWTKQIRVHASSRWYTERGDYRYALLHTTALSL